MSNRIIGILISFIIIFCIVACSNDENMDNMTIGETEQILAEYLEKSNDDIIIGGEGYAEYLSNMLTFENDKKLAKEKYYENIKIYASEYLVAATIPENIVVVQNANGKNLTLLNEEIKSKTKSEVKKEAMDE